MYVLVNNRRHAILEIPSVTMVLGHYWALTLNIDIYFRLLHLQGIRRVFVRYLRFSFILETLSTNCFIIYFVTDKVIQNLV